MASIYPIRKPELPPDYTQGWKDGVAFGERISANRHWIAGVVFALTTGASVLMIALLAIFLSGCAIFEAPEPMPREFAAMISSLQSPEMEAAIQAAKPGVPR